MDSNDAEIRRLGAARWRLRLSLLAVMVVAYFAFMIMVAEAREWMGTQIIAGLSRGMLFGGALIILAWVLIFIYVQWANRVYDPAMKRIRGEQK
ncbi:MAG: DUF485 domain-containing protein [Candidatus Sumerlaeota bacterium]